MPRSILKEVQDLCTENYKAVWKEFGTWISGRLMFMDQKTYKAKHWLMLEKNLEKPFCFL